MNSSSAVHPPVSFAFALAFARALASKDSKNSDVTSSSESESECESEDEDELASESDSESETSLSEESELEFLDPDAAARWERSSSSRSSERAGRFPLPSVAAVIARESKEDVWGMLEEKIARVRSRRALQEISSSRGPPMYR